MKTFIDICIVIFFAIINFAVLGFLYMTTVNWYGGSDKISVELLLYNGLAMGGLVCLYLSYGRKKIYLWLMAVVVVTFLGLLLDLSF